MQFVSYNFHRLNLIYSIRFEFIIENSFLFSVFSLSHTLWVFMPTSHLVDSLYYCMVR